MRPPSNDVSRALGELVAGHRNDDDPPSLSGPVVNPVDRFAHLPVHTRALLESLKAEDVKRIGRLIDEMRDDEVECLVKLMSMPTDKLERLDGLLKWLAAMSVAWGVGKWMIATFVGVLIAMLTLGEKFSGLLRWWSTGVWK